MEKLFFFLLKDSFLSMFDKSLKVYVPICCQRILITLERLRLYENVLTSIQIVVCLNDKKRNTNSLENKLNTIGFHFSRFINTCIQNFNNIYLGGLIGDYVLIRRHYDTTLFNSHGTSMSWHCLLIVQLNKLQMSIYNLISVDVKKKIAKYNIESTALIFCWILDIMKSHCFTYLCVIFSLLSLGNMDMVNYSCNSLVKTLPFAP
ncbi:hypothetical protein BDA99DRAFT_536933 [Phascolomyces articulosus]|uniref:Uncharacterized protein n=1 Tax=Phascolomyces articulosus TaxID=60185 RepID=A0AAD5PE86_9FUNG|nr:hypothetical protein BDA99DRAFT_536933 [Phascolomyces articulosus]